MTVRPSLVGARDHPRIRGEHHIVMDDGAKLEGSSPHTRGARRVTALPARVAGIIPAYAGSTGGGTLAL